MFGLCVACFAAHFYSYVMHSFRYMNYNSSSFVLLTNTDLAYVSKGQKKGLPYAVFLRWSATEKNLNDLHTLVEL